MPRFAPSAASLLTAVAALGGCSGTTGGSSGSGLGPAQHVIVIALENHDPGSIIGNTTDAPYINGTLLPEYASANDFVDPLPLLIPSEPHYVYMEAGTNVFSDVTFTNDAAPSASNSTASTEHLSTQLDAAGKSWIAYQEGMDATSGSCPINSSGYYQPKHDPFIFFQDVSGNPPSADNARCASHHAPFDTLWADLSRAELPDYAFVTPDQCNDMHGQGGCPNTNWVRAGDDWLALHMPDFITYASSHHAVIFVIWDEGEATLTVPFIAVGPGAKKGYVSSVQVDHGSLVKTVERIFALPTLPTVSAVNDFSDFFEPAVMP